MASAADGLRIKLLLAKPHGQDVYVVPTQVKAKVLITVDTSKPVTLHSITVILSGFAHVAHGSDHEDFITNRLVLLSADDAAANRTFVQGNYHFPCQFFLPSTLRNSSFEGLYGHIRYDVEARIETRKGPRFLSSTPSTELYSALLTINVQAAGVAIAPALMSPARATVEKRGLFSSLPMTLTATIPRSAYHAGERIPINVSLNNNSGGKDFTLRASLVQIETYGAGARGTSTVNIVTLDAIESRKIQGRTSIEWAPDLQLAIPSTIPAIFDCSIIKVEHSVEFEVTRTFGTNASVVIPIKLHNVPPPSLVEQLESTPHEFSVTSQPPYLDAQAPPSYQAMNQIQAGAHQASAPPLDPYEVSAPPFHPHQASAPPLYPHQIPPSCPFDAPPPYTPSADPTPPY